MWVEDWTPEAACRDSVPDEMFVRGAAQHYAKVICNQCPVRLECLAEALDNQNHVGRVGRDDRA